MEIIKLIIILIIIPITFIFISILVHEMSHYLKFKKYKISPSIRMKLKTRSHCHLNDLEEKRFLRLSQIQKKEILLAGVKSDIIVLVILVIFSTIFNFYFLIKNIQETQTLNTNIILVTNVLILILFSFQIKSFYANCFYPNSDLELLITHCKKQNPL